jgi:hypothetical protein
MKFILNNNNLKGYILNNISQEKVFAYYLSIDEKDIQYCLIKKQNRISNPLRNDITPSLGFNYYKGKLYMYDFANNFYRGDIFYIIGTLHGLNSRVNKDFVNICRIIIDNIILNKIKDDNTINSFIKLASYNKTSILRIIKIQTRDWDKEDSKIWNKWNLNINDLSSNYVYPVESFWLDNNYYKPMDKCYAYYLGKKNDIDLWEIYFPLRKKSKNYSKFITNNNNRLNCLWELHKTDNLIITKSRKDVLVLKKIINSNPFIFGNSYNVTNFGSETSRLTIGEAEALDKLYNNKYVFTDYDAQGLSCANYHRKRFGFIPIFLTNGRFGTIDYYNKDISDYVSMFGFEKSCTLIKSFLKI